MAVASVLAVEERLFISRMLWQSRATRDFDGSEEGIMEIGCAARYPISRYGFPYGFGNYLRAVAKMHSAGFSACELEINVDIDLAEYEERIEEIADVLAGHEMTLSAIIGVVRGAFSMQRELAMVT